MKNSHFTFLIVLFIIFLCCTNFQCNDCANEIHGRTNYSASISPLKGIYAINDTIEVWTEFSSEVELESSGNIYDNSNQSLQFEIELFEIQPNNAETLDARESFQISSPNGEIPNSDYDLLTSTVWFSKIIVNNFCTTDSCISSLQLIPLKIGYYALYLDVGKLNVEDDCEFISLFPEKIGSGSNNFTICEEIHTTYFRHNRVYFANPQDEDFFYFFKIVE